MGIIEEAKRFDIRHNVSFQVIDRVRGKVVQRIEGHNASTNSMLTGIARYLIGNGVLNQGSSTLENWIPRYISLGTMGLANQDADEHGLPTGLGVGDSEPDRLKNYLQHCPGYGADGYDINNNNGREFFGLGPQFANRPDPTKTVDCELISVNFPRASISYREIVPETASELPKTIDVVFSTIISTGALAQFRETGRDYLFITEAGLWSKKLWLDGGDNGLLAGYRIAPSDKNEWGMSAEAVTDEALAWYQENYDPSATKEDVAAHNRLKLKSSILRVGVNQVVQVVWKIQLGGIEELIGMNRMYPDIQEVYWQFWT